MKNRGEEQFHRDGYTVIRGLFSINEARHLAEHFSTLRTNGQNYPGDHAEIVRDETDPLKRWPRMIHMHRWDASSLRWLLDPRLRDALTALCGLEPLAVQTMAYFKPPRSRGQALHQDQFYLRAKPGNCVAAWMALDPCDEANGCMRIVPGSGVLPLLCTTHADLDNSFTDTTVPLPPHTEAVPMIMDPGDVLFFNGWVIHGSYPNTTPDRFRRALIGHYLTGDVRRVAGYYHPILRFDGTEVKLETSEGGGPCGRWVDRSGKPELEMVLSDSAAPAGGHG